MRSDTPRPKQEEGLHEWNRRAELDDNDDSLQQQQLQQNQMS